MIREVTVLGFICLIRKLELLWNVHILNTTVKMFWGEYGGYSDTANLHDDDNTNHLQSGQEVKINYNPTSNPFIAAAGTNAVAHAVWPELKDVIN